MDKDLKQPQQEIEDGHELLRTLPEQKPEAKAKELPGGAKLIEGPEFAPAS